MHASSLCSFLLSAWERPTTAHEQPRRGAVACLWCNCQAGTLQCRKGAGVLPSAATSKTSVRFNSPLWQAYVSTYSGDKQRQYRLVLAKETRGRFQEDTVASRLLLRAVADASGVATTHFSLGESPEDELTVCMEARWGVA